MTNEAEQYFLIGCGRCSLGGTPKCKIHLWTEELKLLRRIVLDCGLVEDCKWGMPCYTFNGANVVMIASFKEYCSLSFFKGALLQDSEKLLHKQGENSQSARLFKFTKVDQITKIEATIKAYIFEMIELEKSGAKVEMKQKDELVYPEELVQKFEEFPILKTAFENLTPGRKRGYVIHFSQAKQSKTRIDRIEKCVEKILQGKGFFD